MLRRCRQVLRPGKHLVSVGSEQLLGLCDRNLRYALFFESLESVRIARFSSVTDALRLNVSFVSPSKARAVLVTWALSSARSSRVRHQRHCHKLGTFPKRVSLVSSAPQTTDHENEDARISFPYLC